jgi:hypothetical protein
VHPHLPLLATSEPHTLTGVWSRVTGVQDQPSYWLILATAGAALLLVLYPLTWRLSRNAVTIAHEGGHALAALVTGRKLTGIRLHSDTSGVTVSRGRPSGPGMVLTAFAGYTTPPLLGLAAAAMLGLGRLTAVLWISLVLLAAMLLMIRNVFGVISVVVTGGVIFAVSWFAPEDVQAVFAYFAAWFLLIAGVRPVFELQRLRWRGRAPQSDADQLGRLTGVPALFWVVVFGLVAFGSLAGGGYLLVT